MQSTPIQAFIDRPPTPRPYFTVHLPKDQTSHHSLRSPVIMSPVSVRPYSSFSPASNPRSPYFSCGATNILDINVISPSVSSQRSWYMDQDDDADEGFKSPRLALQTSNLLGLGWQERHPSEEIHTPIEGSAECTPISPSSSEELRDYTTEEDLYSPQFELLVNNFWKVQDDVEAPYTPISPSASDDLEGDDWIPNVPTQTSTHHPQLSLLTKGDFQPDTWAFHTPLTPPSEPSYHQPRLALLTDNHFQPDTWAFHTPLTPPEAAQQFEEDLSRDSARRYKHTYNQSLHASELYTPISPSPHDYTSKFSFHVRDLEGPEDKNETSDPQTPISASTTVQQGWRDLLFDISTPAERFFVPEFDISRVSAPGPILAENEDQHEQNALCNDDDEEPQSCTWPVTIDLPAQPEDKQEDPIPRTRKPRAASVSSIPAEIQTLRSQLQRPRRRRHSISILDGPTRQRLNEGILLSDSVFQRPDNAPTSLDPVSQVSSLCTTTRSTESLVFEAAGAEMSRTRRHSFCVLDRKLREWVDGAVVLTSAVYITEMV